MSDLKTNDNFKFCVIVSDENPDKKFILLDNEPLILGKKQQTGTVNPKMSKNQMKIIAEYSTSRVWVQQLGTSRSAVNNETMTKGEKRLLSYGDKISLLYKTNHTYHLDFLTPNYGIDYDKRNTLSLNEEIIPEIPEIPEIPLSNSTLLWDNRDDTLLVFNSPNIIHKDKIAIFEMTVLSGKAFPDDEDNWPMCKAEVIRSIEKLSDDGYKIVLFTYQGGMVFSMEKKNTFQKKIENIPKLIKTPVQVFIATRKDIYKLPAPGMWNILVSDFNGGISVDMEKSFFCGGNAGRLDGFDSDDIPIQKDPSCCDRLFAMNIGLKFYTPEQYFLKDSTPQIIASRFNPKYISSNICYTNLSSKVLFSSKREMIIMVGCPGSGKSYFAANKLICHDNMKIINRDILGSWQKCFAKITKYLRKGSLSVLIDNRHPDVASRKQFIEIAKNLKVPCRVFLMKVSKEHAKHNNKFLELTDELHTKVSEREIDLYFSKFQKPTKKEGIKEIVPINFVPHFKDPNHEKLYKMFLL